MYSSKKLSLLHKIMNEVSNAEKFARISRYVMGELPIDEAVTVNIKGIEHPGSNIIAFSQLLFEILPFLNSVSIPAKAGAAPAKKPNTHCKNILVSKPKIRLDKPEKNFGMDLILIHADERMLENTVNTKSEGITVRRHISTAFWQW